MNVASGSGLVGCRGHCSWSWREGRPRRLSASMLSCAPPSGIWNTSAERQRVYVNHFVEVCHLQPRTRLWIDWVVFEAIAYLLDERRRMHDALHAMGHFDGFELEPRGYREQLKRFADGTIQTIGSETDPFVLMADREMPVARYYIKAIAGRCVVILTGSAKFMSTLKRMTHRDESKTLH